MSTPWTPDAMAFATARRATDRSALARFIAAQGDDTATARTAFNNTAPLLAAGVATIARVALAGALGPAASTVTWTTWPHVRHTWGGARMTATWPGFGAWHAAQAAQVVAKGESTAYAPVTNVDGRRCNASTRAMHMLVLDADGTGDWFVLWQEIVALDLAALLHRTASHTPHVPKWRVAFPLATPVPTTSPRLVLTWRSMYATARTAFGSLAALSGPGFDPSTDGPHHPWFPGSRRTVDTPMPEVVLRPGRTLDLEALVARLPPGPPRPVPVAAEHGNHRSSLLALAFEAAGLLGAELGRGRTAAVCPWNHNHTEPLPEGAEPTSATVIFSGNSEANVGAFHCSHASCGTKTPQEVLAELPADAVEHARAVHRVQRSGWPGRALGDIGRLGLSVPGLRSDLFPK